MMTTRSLIPRLQRIRKNRLLKKPPKSLNKRSVTVG
jgi:hypothetical protein